MRDVRGAAHAQEAARLHIVLSPSEILFFFNQGRDDIGVKLALAALFHLATDVTVIHRGDGIASGADKKIIDK